uniref:Uncharacterized protein n=1 Tax=Anguilla anguilla TaxID=7936 RepID=A0A0E9TD53_ANGAN
MPMMYFIFHRDRKQTTRIRQQTLNGQLTFRSAMIRRKNA